jgi:hypothetical protein
MIVTRTPSVAIIRPYSTPITPPPTTIIDRGMRSRLRNSSESKTVRPSKGMCLGREGFVPGASSTLSADKYTGPSGERTSMVCGSTKLASPTIVSTPLRSNWSWMTSHSRRDTCCSLCRKSSIVIDLRERYCSP